MYIVSTVGQPATRRLQRTRPQRNYKEREHDNFRGSSPVHPVAFLEINIYGSSNDYKVNSTSLGLQPPISCCRNIVDGRRRTSKVACMRACRCPGRRRLTPVPPVPHRSGPIDPVFLHLYPRVVCSRPLSTDNALSPRLSAGQRVPRNIPCI